MTSTAKKRISKIYLVFTLVSLFTIMFVVYIHNERIKDSVVKRISQIENVTPPETSFFKNLRIRFGNIHCEGIFRYTCSIDNSTLFVTGKKNNYEVLKIGQIRLKNISRGNLFGQNGSISAQLIDIVPSKKLTNALLPINSKDKEIKNTSKRIYNLLFPANIDIEILYKKRRNVKTNLAAMDLFLHFSIENSSLKFSAKTHSITEEINKPYEVIIDKNGDFVEETPDKVLAKITLSQMYFTIIKEISLSVENKNIFDLSYSIYKLTMLSTKEKSARKKFNEYLLGLKSDQILDRSTFRKEISEKFEIYRNENPNTIGKAYAEFMRKAINDEKVEMYLQMTLEKPLTLEQFLVSSSAGIIKDKEAFFEKYYKIQYKLEKKE